MKHLTTKYLLFKRIKEYLLIIIMGMLIAASCILFVVPNEYAPSGVTGIAIMIQYKLNFSIGYMGLLINIPLCIFAYFFVNKKFAIRTLVFSLTYSLFYLYLQTKNLSAYQYDAQGVDTIFPAMIAGGISGFCYGVLFKKNGSTGGTDIIAKYLNKKKPQLNFFYVTFAINVAVALASFFVYAHKDVNGNMIYDYKPICLCMVYSFLGSFVGNFMIKDSKSAYQCMIVTTHADEIEKEIITKLHHAATRIQGSGVYSSTEKTLLICVINKIQLVDFENIISQYPDTFTFVQTVNQTIGNFRIKKQ